MKVLAQFMVCRHLTDMGLEVVQSPNHTYRSFRCKTDYQQIHVTMKLEEMAPSPPSICSYRPSSHKRNGLACADTLMCHLNMLAKVTFGVLPSSLVM